MSCIEASTSSADSGVICHTCTSSMRKIVSQRLSPSSTEPWLARCTDDSTPLSRPVFGSKMPVHRMPSTTPGSAQGRISTAMSRPRPRNGLRSTTAKKMPSTVDSTTPMATYRAVLPMLVSTTLLANSRRKLPMPSNRVGGSRGLTR